MSEVTTDTIQKVAALSGLSLSDAEIEKYQKQFNEIVSFFELLDTIDTDGVEPTYQVTGLKNVYRDDIVVDYGVDQAALLQNAPAVQNGQIKVERVL